MKYRPVGRVSEQELIESRRIVPEADKDFFVFAYGSLMWRPDFPFAEIWQATLFGYHRTFCILSTHYRGSSACPGLVLGLDRGGMCIGRLYRVSASDAPAVATYLHEREMISGCYLPKWVNVRREDGLRQTALAYVADPNHEQYAGKLEDEAIIEMIVRACGSAGKNIDYLRNTVCHLDELGIRESRLHRILRRVDKLAGDAI